MLLITTNALGTVTDSGALRGGLGSNNPPKCNANSTNLFRIVGIILGAPQITDNICELLDFNQKNHWYIFRCKNGDRLF